jgi:hypothetical protein
LTTRRGGGPASLPLKWVLTIATDEIGDRHPHRVVLHLPHVAELMRQQLLGTALHRLSCQDAAMHRVALKLAKPGKPKQAWSVDDRDAGYIDRAWVELEGRESLPSSFKSGNGSGVVAHLTAPAGQRRRTRPS